MKPIVFQVKSGVILEDWILFRPDLVRILSSCISVMETIPLPGRTQCRSCQHLLGLPQQQTDSFFQASPSQRPTYSDWCWRANKGSVGTTMMNRMCSSSLGLWLRLRHPVSRSDVSLCPIYVSPSFTRVLIVSSREANLRQYQQWSKNTDNTMGLRSWMTRCPASNEDCNTGGGWSREPLALAVN